MKIILDITKANSEGIVKDLDDSNYLCLGSSDTERKDLFIFAVALAYHNDLQPAELKTKKDTFVRAEYLGNNYFIYSSLFFSDEVAEGRASIEDITDPSKVLKIAEEYANSGFDVIRNHYNIDNEEQLMYKLIGEMDEMYEDNETDIKNLF